MTYARKSLVSLHDTPYYYVVAGCVRRAWLWGFDEYAGRDYSHRKRWVLERFTHLSAIFTIDICAYAVMSNHYHLVVHVDRGGAWQLTDEEVVERWTQMFSAPPLIERWRKAGTRTSIDLSRSRVSANRWASSSSRQPLLAKNARASVISRISRRTRRPPHH